MRHTPRRNSAVLVAAVAFLASSASPAAAQERSRGSLPANGDWSVMLTAFEPDVTTHFGLFRMIGDRANVGVEAELNWSDGKQTVRQQGLRVTAEATTWSFLIGPSVRWYGMRTGPVSPYLRTRLGVGWGGSHLHVNENRQNDEETFTLTASLGIGAEWHPIRWLGVGGHTGLAWTRTDTETVNDTNESNFDGMTQNLRTFRSGLVVNFYFR